LYQIFGNYDAVFPRVKRIYVVGNFRQGIVRGFHRHLKEWKVYFVTLGSAKFITVNPTEEIEIHVLTQRNPQLLVVPPEHAHGWVSLEDDTLLIGMSNFSLEESEADDLRLDPFLYGDLWEAKPR
jgi:dTDP-4-dehydrorhamnose 3,5-epimerase-like enzyme